MIKVNKARVLKRIYDCCSIQNPAGPSSGGGGKLPMRMTPIQGEFFMKSKAFALKGHQDYAVKPRQVGLSTLCMCYIIAMMEEYPGFSAIWVSQDDANARIIRAKWDIILDAVMDSPLSTISNTTKRRRNDSEFSLNNGSSVKFTFAGDTESDAKSTGRGDTIHFAVFTESAYWSHAREAYNAIIPGMEHSNPSIVWDSTPNGTVGDGAFFYGRVQSVLSGELDGTVHFWPWHMETRYAIELNPGEEERIRATLSEAERFLIEESGLNLSQIKWRRKKISDLGSIEKFCETYPETMEDAFQSPGKSVFRTDVLSRARRHINAGLNKPYIDMEKALSEAGLLMDGMDILTECHDDPRRKYQARFYVDPKDTIRAPFEIGVDTSSGEPGCDPSGIHIMDRNAKTVGVVSGPLTPYMIANTITRIVLLYGLNLCNITIEDQSTGPEVRRLLASEMSMEDIVKYGLHESMSTVINSCLEQNNVATRPTIVGTLIESVNKSFVKLDDPLLVHQASSFVRDKNGKVGHSNGTNDDNLLALAMALRGRERRVGRGSFIKGLEETFEDIAKVDSVYDEISLQPQPERGRVRSPDDWDDGPPRPRGGNRNRRPGGGSGRSAIFDLAE